MTPPPGASPSSAVRVAARAAWAEIRVSRSVRWVSGTAVVLAVLIGVAYFLRLLDEAWIVQLRRQGLTRVIPLAALLLSDIPIRRPLRDRTLIHHILGPVPRVTLAVVRSGIVAAALGAVSAAIILLFGLVTRAGVGVSLADAFVALLTAWAYVGLGSMVYAWTRRGFLFGLCVLVFIDFPLSTVPFALRNLAPSAHVAMASGRLPMGDWGSALGTFVAPAGPAWVSVVVLVGIGAVGMFVAANRFRRMSLAELC